MFGEVIHVPVLEHRDMAPRLHSVTGLVGVAATDGEDEIRTEADRRAPERPHVGGRLAALDANRTEPAPLYLAAFAHPILLKACSASRSDDQDRRVSKNR